MFAQTQLFGADDLRQVLERGLWSSASQLFLKNQAHAEIERVEGRSRARAPAGRFWGLMTADGPSFGGFFGGTRVLCLGPGSREDGASLRRVAVGAERGFRIVIGSRDPVQGFLDALGDRVEVEMKRSQPFLAVGDVGALGEGTVVRPGSAADIAWLTHASIRLNEEDLGISPRSVDKGLLERRIRERIQQASTWIVEREGRAVCKLEIGNDGPAGSLIEGVYTEDAVRGHGLARRLCAEIARRQLQHRPWVGLHVGRENDFAMRAYLAAGFVEIEDLTLALIHWK